MFSNVISIFRWFVMCTAEKILFHRFLLQRKSVLLYIVVDIRILNVPNYTRQLARSDLTPKPIVHFRVCGKPTCHTGSRGRLPYFMWERILYIGSNKYAFYTERIPDDTHTLRQERIP